MKRSKALSDKLATVFTEYAPRVHTAAEAAESRLAELEDRDQRRDQRDADRREATVDKYPALKNQR